MSKEQDDDDEDEFKTLYNDGHWEWSNVSNKLVFISHESPLPPDLEILTPAAFKQGRILFRDDIDLIEQQTYRKRFQRRSLGEEDVVLLQDVKDLALYTAPVAILSVSVIQILHLPSTERFIRALILYCQYYIQTSDKMSNRLLEMEYKVRTPVSTDVELELRENLEDLRLLIAKEYGTFLLGGKDYNNFHHMGPDRKLKSLSKKDALIFESFLLITIQMVWLALGRKSFDQIELLSKRLTAGDKKSTDQPLENIILEFEVHRMFKSHKFNVVEHRLYENRYSMKMAPEEKFVLMGHCLQNRTKLYIKSPLMDEVSCHRPIDFRLLGLGNVKYSCLTFRQMYLEQLLTASEHTFQAKGLTLGILGMPRKRFDIMLMEIKRGTTSASSGTLASSRSLTHSSVSKSRACSSTASVGNRIYDDIVLPEKSCEKEWLPEEFPTETCATRPCDSTQKKKWINRQIQLIKKQQKARKQSKK